MNTIVYKNAGYLTRTFTVLHNGEEHTRTISVESLSNAMGEAKEEHNSEEEAIDSEIYYYVPDNVINLHPTVICEKYLDEPMMFIEEEF